MYLNYTQKLIGNQYILYSCDTHAQLKVGWIGFNFCVMFKDRFIEITLQ